jgi:tRNA A-37 threonylcarbamoyl transferase component Bud32
MSSSLSENLEQILNRFEDAWNGPTPPRIEDFLLPAGSPRRLPTLIELLKIDMTRRLERGERVRLEEMYLPRFHELGDAPSPLLDLVVYEYELRRHEPGLSCAEYLKRWPRFRDELARRLQMILQLQMFFNPTPDIAFHTLPLPAETPSPGACLGQYELLNELGRGGMGIVYRALDRKRNRPVALKTIQSMSADALYRFKQEFRLRADLHHPNLVSLHELIAEGGHWFFTMELVEGSDFLRYVRGGADALSPPAAAPLTSPEQYQRLRQALRQLAEGIEALHAAGRLHRDLKPGNVMVTRTSRVVLLDFGLVAQLNTQQVHESTTHHLLGTAAYMSPEQARSEALSPASDWYSVGVMLYEALTGQLPFKGFPFQILSDKQLLDPPSPRALNPDIPQDLDALCIALLSRDPAARPSGRHCLRLIGERSGDSTHSLEMHAPGVTLVGREEQLAALADAYAVSRNRRTVTLFLWGPSGVGKSSLLHQFLNRLRAAGEAVVLSGQCYEQESVPYKAFDGVIDALGRFLRRLAPLEVQALLPRDVTSLLRVFPTLRRVEALLSVPQGREAPDPQEVRQRAFASLRELLGRLTDRKPVVICIDDLQWGDADSAALLTELIRPPDAPCLLFIGCHRSEESDSPFLTALAESNRFLWSEVDRRELRLDPLSIPEAEELATRLLDSPEAKGRCAAAIARESGGNPFFVYELVRYLRGELGQSLAEGAINLGEVLWRRIEQLPAETRELLAVVALAARPVPQDAACRAAGLAQGRIEELALLRSQRLACGSGMSGEDFLVAYHDRIREIFRAHLTAEQTRRLHGRLAEALEAWGRADAEWLAMHWEFAGERRRAGEYYGRAADLAAQTLAFDNAADLYRRALQMGPDDADLRRQLQRKLGDALANAGRGHEAAKAYQVLRADASGMGVIELQRKVTEQFIISGYVEEGLAAAQDLLHSVGLSMPRTPARAVLGILLTRARLWIRGLKFREHSEAEVPTRDLCRVDASWIMGTSLALIDTIRGAYFQTRNLLLSLQIGEPYRVARALAMLAAYNACAGPSVHRRTSRLLALSEALAHQVENPHAQGMVLLATGIVAYLEGRWREAFHACSQAEDFLRSRCTGVHWEVTTARSFQVWSLRFLGEIAEMNRLCYRFMKEAQAHGDLHGIANLLFYAMPVLSMAADHAEQGYEELCDGLEQWTRKGFHIQHMSALAMKIQLLLYLGKTTAAEKVFRELSKALYRSQLHRVQLMRVLHYDDMARVSLRAARDASNSTPYLKVAERSAVHLTRKQRPDARSLATLHRAGIANCKGDLDQAKQLLEAALTGFTACELGLYAAAARRSLGQLMGGDHGKALVAEADRWMTAQGIRNPARMTAVYAPGFADL